MHSSETLLSNLHQAAVQKEPMALPSTKSESWRYTDLSRFLKKTFLPVEGKAFDGHWTLPESMTALLDESEELAVFVDGQFAPEFSRLTGALRLLPSWSNADLEKCFADVEAADNFIRFRNAAYLNGGAAFEVAAGRVAAVHLLYVYTERHRPYQTAVRNLVRVADGAELSFTESHVALGDGQFLANAVTDIHVGERGRADVLRLHAVRSGMLLNHTSWRLARDAQADYSQITVGGQLNRNEAHIVLEQENASVRMNGLALVRGRQHVDNHTTIHHRVGQTQSDQLIKNFLCDEARAVFNGRLIIDENAQQSDARQLNQNLLLGDRAEVDTRPQLEVFADDVKAAHGASIGQLDQDQLFYLMSRGIGRAQATRLLAEGFLEDVVSRVNRASLRNKALKLLKRSFHEYVEVAL